jgi:hypothetical protein
LINLKKILLKEIPSFFYNAIIMKLFLLSLLLTLSEYNFYKTPPKFLIVSTNTTLYKKIEHYDPVLVSFVSISNMIILHKMDFIESSKIYNLKALMNLIDNDIGYVHRSVSFTNNIIFVFIAFDFF